ncbi:MAG: alpha-L-arabinofuranosidase C-terminal domain-containing protein [Candidatus Azotimanducaceae bacterium]|uniref:Alpha-L-arabinofuranosidase C-terminal domain-containing protein n=1 Tax=OM182 bacterium TaxID=2510334 RepID=A0A520S308_9GAMM|nr:MAG: hypothetical protein EVA68_03025 [OM182 bacterium]
MRHADVVKIANLAQVGNAIAPLKTLGDEPLKYTTFHAFKLFSERKEGRPLHLGVSGNCFDTDEGPVTCMDASCIYSLDQANLSLFIINLSPIDKMSVIIDLLGLEVAG